MLLANFTPVGPHSFRRFPLQEVSSEIVYESYTARFLKIWWKYCIKLLPWRDDHHPSNCNAVFAVQ